MSVYWYDEAIITNLRNVTGDSRVTIIPPETLFRYVANLKNDEIQFPLVALSRLGYTLKQVQRTPFSSQGYPLNIPSKDGGVDEIQSIPCVINYQLDIIARKRKDNDEMTEELIFYLVNHPTLSVQIAKGANVSHKFSLQLSEDIEDNSDIESHMSRGEYFRSTIMIQVPDARLWKTTSKKVYRVDPITLVGTTDLEDDSKAYLEENIEIKNEGDNS